MTTNQTAPVGPWTFNESRESIEDKQGNMVADLFASPEQININGPFIVAACNACMAVSPDSPITVAECIPELVKLARLVTSRPEWQLAVDDLGLSNQIHKLLTCIERRHR